LKFKNPENGPLVKRRKTFEPPDLEPALAPVTTSDDTTVSSTRQVLQNSIFGSTSAEINILTTVVTTVAQRIAQLHPGKFSEQKKKKAKTLHWHFKPEYDLPLPAESAFQNAYIFDEASNSFQVPVSPYPTVDLHCTSDFTRRFTKRFQSSR
jgi:hypothetical protein